MPSDEYIFTVEQPTGTGEIRLEWVKRGEKMDPLNFWIVPAHISEEEAKARVRAGEFD